MSWAEAGLGTLHASGAGTSIPQAGRQEHLATTQHHTRAPGSSSEGRESAPPGTTLNDLGWGEG